MDEQGTATIAAPELANGGNRLLSALAPSDLTALAPHCRRVRLPIGAVLADADRPLAAAYFPERGIVSAIKQDARGERTEILLLGPENFVGAALTLADGRSPYAMLVQIDELIAIRIDAQPFAACVAGNARFHHLLMGAVHSQMVQVAEGLASAAWQKINARLARWLLMCRDRLGDDRIAVTHEFMALTIGAQRTGITAALHELEGQGLIAATRGRVILRDVAGLESLADGSYGLAEREQARLLTGFA